MPLGDDFCRAFRVCVKRQRRDIHGQPGATPQDGRTEETPALKARFSRPTLNPRRSARRTQAHACATVLGTPLGTCGCDGALVARQLLQHGLKLTRAHGEHAISALVECCAIVGSGQQRRAYARIPLQTERVLDASPFPKGRGRR
jgi:hypothetical protein